MDIQKTNGELESQEKSQSIFDLAKQLEVGKVKSDVLTRDVLKKCAEVYKARGYSNGQIAEILGVDAKTIQRYIKKQREENTLNVDEAFQKSMISEVINNWRAQYQRLLKLSYSEGLSPSEIMKAIYLAHQVEKDGIELLERLGYLNKVMTINSPGFKDLLKIIEE